MCRKVDRVVLDQTRAAELRIVKRLDKKLENRGVLDTTIYCARAGSMNVCYNVTQGAVLGAVVLDTVLETLPCGVVFGVVV